MVIKMLICLSLIETEEEKSKFEQLYIRYKNIMYYVAFQILKDSYSAEDAVHQAFLRVINHLNKINIKDCHKTKAFLIAIVENISIDIYRKRKRENVIPFDEVTIYEDKINNISEFEQTYCILDAIKRLPIIYSSVLRLKFSQGYTDNEISNILNISEDNVRKRISRGKKMLEKLLSEGDVK